MTKFALAMMFQNEAEWLRLHLPVILKDAPIDGLVGVDGGSTDGSADVFRSFGGAVYHRPFDMNFGAQGNALIDAAIHEGYDALIRLDPDELIFPSSFARIRGYLEQYPIVSLPRYNFARTRVHWVSEWYPDPQYRGFRLDKGLRYQGVVHESPQPLEGAKFIPGANLYHYSGVRGDSAGMKRSAVYGALGRGEQASWDMQPDTKWRYPGYARWPSEWAQPLDPYAAGIHAPYDRAPGITTTPNLSGDRGVEYGWCMRHMGRNLRGHTALDLGSAGHLTLSTEAWSRGYDVTALDCQPFGAPPCIRTVVDDMRTYQDAPYDLIINCSTVEHVGLSGRYGVTDDDTYGDLKAMANLRTLLKLDGKMLLTIPVGRDKTHKPMHRVYGDERLPALLYGYEVLESAFYRKSGDTWCECSKNEALDTYSHCIGEDWRACCYAIGCFVLGAE